MSTLIKIVSIILFPILFVGLGTFDADIFDRAEPLIETVQVEK